MKLKFYSDYPKAASENAQRALDYREESGNPNDCLTRVGWIRANQLAKREDISEDIVARIASFARFLQYEDKDIEDGCGKLALLAWGGREGIEWAQRKMDEIEKEEELNETEQLIEDLEDFLASLR